MKILTILVLLMIFVGLSFADDRSVFPDLNLEQSITLFVDYWATAAIVLSFIALPEVSRDVWISEKSMLDFVCVTLLFSLSIMHLATNDGTTVSIQGIKIASF